MNVKLLSLIGLFVSFCICNVFSSESKNLLKESGGEQAIQEEWQFLTARGTNGKAMLVSSDRDNGKCIKLTMSNYKGKSGCVKCISKFIAIPDGTSEVQVSAWIKGKDIVKGTAYKWEKFRFVITAFDNKKKRVKRWEIFTRDGSFAWSKVESKILLHPETVYLKLDFQLLRCKGTAWVDDVKLISIGKKAGSLVDNLQKLISTNTSDIKIYPNPWKVKLYKKYATFANPVLVNDSGVNVRRAIEEMKILWENKLKLGTSVPNSPVIYLQKPNDDKLLSDKLFKAQGYILEVKNSPPKVFIKAFSPAGFFWAVQTLKQLVKKDGRIRCCLIKDRPGYSIRGNILQGRARGLNPVEIKKHLKFMKTFKLNTLLTTGSMLNYKFCQKWREQFSPYEQELLKKYVSECNKNFVSPLMLIAPRCFRKKHRNYGKGSKPIVFSSESDIKLLLGKVDFLYNIGVRSIGLTYDDLPQFGLRNLIDPQDKKKFKSPADAHVYLTNRLYKYLSTKPEPCKVMFLPAAYYDSEINSPSGEKYLKAVRKLNKSITLIACATTREIISKVKELTQHQDIIIWSNWLAHWSKHRPMPPILPPYPGENFSDVVDGYIYLASIPRETSRNSDYTVCDYIWNPANYNPDRSQLFSLLRIFPRKSLKLLTRFEKLSKKIRNNEFIGNDSKEKVKTIDSYIKKLNFFKKEVENSIKGGMKKQYLKTIGDYLEKCRNMKQLFLSKNFPITVNKSSHTINLDGKLNDTAWESVKSHSGFIKVNSFEQAELQTSFKLLYDEKYIYVAAECHENPGYKLKNKIKNHDGKVFLDDCVEVFLKPQKSPPYFHIIVNSSGVIADSIDSMAKGFVSDHKWSSQAKIFIKKNKNDWTVEIAIPFSSLGSKPGRGMTWEFNIGREKQNKNKEFSSYTGVFHDPSRFWKIVFK